MVMCQVMDNQYVKKIIETKLVSKVRTCKRCFTWDNQQIADWLKVSVETVNKILGVKNGKEK